MNDLRKIRYFVAVAEELHFGKAAVRLHVSQPPLSQQIKALEASVGVSLLKRDRRSVQLTPAGCAYLAHAYEVLRAADLAEQAAQRAASGEYGELRIGYSYSALYSDPVLNAIVTYRKHHPAVEIRLIEGTTRGHVEDIELGRIDTAFVRGPLPSHALRWPASRIQLLSHEGLLVALPKQHSLTSRPSLRLEDLAQQPFVSFARGMGTALNELIDGLLAPLPQQPAIAVETRDMASLLGLVGAGAGIALVPDSVASQRSEHVVFRPLAEQAAQIGLYQLQPPQPVPTAMKLAALLVPPQVLQQQAQRSGKPSSSRISRSS